MVHDEHKPFGDNYDYRNDPEGLIYWKKGRVVPGTDIKTPKQCVYLTLVYEHVFSTAMLIRLPIVKLKKSLRFFFYCRR